MAAAARRRDAARSRQRLAAAGLRSAPPALEGRAADAARLAGYADAAYARNDDERQSNEAAAVERARTLTRATLGEAQAARLQAEGARSSDDEAATLAFGTAR